MTPRRIILALLSLLLLVQASGLAMHLHQVLEHAPSETVAGDAVVVRSACSHHHGLDHGHGHEPSADDRHDAPSSDESNKPDDCATCQWLMTWTAVADIDLSASAIAELVVFGCLVESQDVPLSADSSVHFSRGPPMG